MKSQIFSEDFLKEIYFSKTCFLFIDEENVVLASPAATRIINEYDLYFWDQIKDDELNKEEIISNLITYLKNRDHECHIVEIKGIFVLTFSKTK